MALKQAYGTTVVIEQLPKACDVAGGCYRYALAKFERIKEAPRGRMRKTTHVLHDVNETYSLDLLDHHSLSTPLHANMTVRVPLGGIASLFPEPSAVARSMTVDSSSATGTTSSSHSERSSAW